MSRYFLTRRNRWLRFIATSILSFAGMTTSGWAQEASPVVLQTAESFGATQSLSTQAEDLTSPGLEFSPALVDSAESGLSLYPELLSPPGLGGA